MEGRISSCGTERRTRLQTAGVLLAKRPEDCVNLLNDSGFKRLFSPAPTETTRTAELFGHRRSRLETCCVFSPRSPWCRDKVLTSVRLTVCLQSLRPLGGEE